ncbi:MAG TPA: ArsA-related P-loop ATPase [Candidatus Dormibacteraeota bacterium]|jgi:anion-transporting  ArsA/GET3 family ATPase|nr:ArsA-related P-loop ATPase [Candidatus Dormibacteraeota bacterium]
MPSAPGLLDDLLAHRLVILTGKGGVGKSTSSAALALIAARRGKRVLLIEVDAKGNLADFFDSRRAGFAPRRFHEGVYGLSMQANESMREYMNLSLRMPGFSLKPLEGFIGYVSGAIPGLKEILVTGKIYWEEKQVEPGGRPRWDLIVVDGAPTGHVVSQLGAARHLAELVRSGPIHDQAIAVGDLLADRTRSALVLVSTPEEMPVSETIDLAGRFERETDIRPAALLVNQNQRAALSEAQMPAFRELVGAGRGRFLAEHPEGGPLLAAGEIMLDGLDRAERLGSQLRQALDLPTLDVPYVFQRHHGFAFTRSLAKAMESA